MTKLVLESLAPRGPGMTQRELFDAIETRKDTRLFPGDMHRMWAKEALLALATRRAIVQVADAPTRWRLA